MKGEDRIGQAIAATSRPAEAPTETFRLGLFNGRAAMLTLPLDTTDEEMLFIAAALVNVVRPTLAQKRIKTGLVRVAALPSGLRS